MFPRDFFETTTAASAPDLSNLPGNQVVHLVVKRGELPEWKGKNEGKKDDENDSRLFTIMNDKSIGLDKGGKRSSFSFMADNVTTSLKDIRVAVTPRRVLQDSTNCRERQRGGPAGEVKVEEETGAVPLTWSSRPKKRLKENGGRFVYTDAGRTRGENPGDYSKRTPPSQSTTQYSSALSRLSETIDAGVSECMDCLSELKTKNTKYDHLLRAIKDEINEIRVNSAKSTPTSGACASLSLASEKAEGEAAAPVSVDSQRSMQATPHLQLRTPSLAKAWQHHSHAYHAGTETCTPSCSLSLSTVTAGSASSTEASERIRSMLVCTPWQSESGRGEGGGMVDSGRATDSEEHSFQLACAQSLIEQGIAAMGSGEKEGARERVALAIQALQSVMFQWKDDDEEEEEEQQQHSREESTLVKRMVKKFSSPDVDIGDISAPGTSQSLTKTIEKTAEKSVRILVPSSGTKDKTPENLNLEQIFSRAWAGASPALWKTPLPALTPLPVSTQILQGFTFPLPQTETKVEKREESTSREKNKEKCAIM